MTVIGSGLVFEKGLVVEYFHDIHSEVNSTRRFSTVTFRGPGPERTRVLHGVPIYMGLDLVVEEGRVEDGREGSTLPSTSDHVFTYHLTFYVVPLRTLYLYRSTER